MFVSDFFQYASQSSFLPESISKSFNRAASYFEQHEKKRALFAELLEAYEAGTLDQLDACIRISNSVHEKMWRRDGKHYVESHIKSVVDAPNRYAEIQYTDDQIKLAWTHDTPEDAKGAWKVKHFRKLGFSDEFCDGLDGMTQRKGEKYFDYIERLSKTIALEVKIGDNRHNMSDHPKPIRAMLYEISSQYLLDVKYGKIEAGSSIAEWAARKGFYDLDLFKKYSSRPLIEDNIKPPRNFVTSVSYGMAV